MRRRFLTTALALALATCVGEPATGPSSDTSLRLPIQPAIIPGAADETALPINRIRAVVREATGAEGDGTVLTEARFDVDPEAESWEIDIDVPLASSSAEVVVELSLIHASGGTEVVEFSGITDPMTLESGASVEPADVDIVRGPLANLHVTGVTIGEVPGQLLEGTSAALTAEVSSTDEDAPEVFWVSLEEEVAVVSDSVVTAVAPGITEIVAAAGAHSDTTTLEVLPAPGDPAVFKTVSATQVEEGDTVDFTVLVFNGGGTDVEGLVVEEHLPDGVSLESFEATAGVFDPDAATPLWSFELLPAGALDTLSLTVTVDDGTAGTTLQNEARLVLPVEFEDPEVENNVAFAEVDVVEPFTGDGDILITSELPVGAGLQAFYSGELSDTTHGGTTVTIESLDPDALLVSPPDVEVEGTATTTYDVPDGFPLFFFHPHGLEGVRDTVPVVASAEGFTPDTVHVAVVETVVSLYGVHPAPDTLTGLNIVYAGVGANTPDGPVTQAVRAGAEPLEVTLSSDNPSVLLPTTVGGAGASVTAEISPTSAYTGFSLDEGGFALDPVDIGSAEASVSIPGFGQMNASQLVEVGAPELVIFYSGALPASLQAPAVLYLGDSWAHGGSTMTITSTDPERVLFAPDSLTPGTSSLDLAVPDSVLDVPFWIQGDPFAQAGQLSVIASEPRFVADTLDVSVVEPVAVLTDLDDRYGPTDPNQPFRVEAGYDSGSGFFVPRAVNPLAEQGAGVSAYIESSDPQVLSLVTNEFPDGTGSVVVSIPVGEHASPETVDGGGVELSIEGEGEATITVTVEGFGQIADLSSRTITVAP
ncbi:MAG: hypothetical protein U5R14_15640 [Gemmatimonadota bacterium]|nr:hypothetical protein [Gemmatimonadota bacterium]